MGIIYIYIYITQDAPLYISIKKMSIKTLNFTLISYYFTLISYIFFNGHL